MSDDGDAPPLLVPIPDATDAHSLPPSSRSRTPVVILTGFLGAGKSTLINHILTSSDHDLRVAVVMNDYEDGAEIERRVSVAKAGGKERYDGWIGLANGCLCCSVKDVSVKAIEDMVMASSQGIDLVLVEAAGAADPVKLISMFWLDERLESCLRLDGVIAMVDASRLHLLTSGSANSYAELMARQIGVADRVILNKRDLIPSTDAAGAYESVVLNINPTANLHWTEYASIPVELLTTIASFETNAAFAWRQTIRTPETRKATAVNHQVSSCVLQFDHAVDIVAFESRLQQLLWDPLTAPTTLTTSTTPTSVLRVKGILAASDGVVYAVQAAGQLYDLEPLQHVDVLADTSILLLVGEQLNSDHLRKYFHASI